MQRGTGGEENTFLRRDVSAKVKERGSERGNVQSTVVRSLNRAMKNDCLLKEKLG